MSAFDPKRTFEVDYDEVGKSLMGNGMYLESVEVLSDQSNMAVIRHPSRKFPGVLVQGDTLHALYTQAAAALEGGPDSRDELIDLRDRLQAMLDHYSSVMALHGQALPYRE